MFVLPEPVGPGDQHHAERLQNGFLEFLQRLGLEAELGHVETQVFFVQQPQTIFSPHSVGRVLTR